MLNSNHDTSIFFEEYIASIDSLPSEIHQHCKELREKDEQYQKIREQISHEYTSIYKYEKVHGFMADNPNEPTIIGNVRKEMKETQSLADEKVEISEKTLKLIALHIKRLNETLSKIQNNNPTASHSETKNNIVVPKTEETKSSEHAQKTSRNHQHTHSHTNINLKNRKNTSLLKSSLSRKRRKLESTDTANTSTVTETNHKDVNPNGEPLYCICRQISYGNMIACDNQKNCPHEWFHYECVGLVEPPKGS